MLPAFLGLARGDFHDRPVDRGAQPGRGQRPGPAQHHGLSGPGLSRVQQHRGLRDDHRLAAAHDPGPERRPGAGQVDLQLLSQRHDIPGRRAGLTQHRSQLLNSELITGPGHLRRPRHHSARRGTAPDQLRDRGVLTAADVGLNPVPRADHPGQLVIGRARVPVIIPGRHLRELAQRQAAGRHVQRLPRREPRRPAREHPRHGIRGPGHPRTPPPGRRRGVRRHRRGQTRPGQQHRLPDLLGGDSLRLAGQLPGIHVRRRRVVRILAQAHVTGILIPPRQVRRVIHPSRPRRHQAGILVPPGLLGNRSWRHVPRSVRMNDLVRTQ